MTAPHFHHFSCLRDGQSTVDVYACVGRRFARFSHFQRFGEAWLITQLFLVAGRRGSAGSETSTNGSHDVRIDGSVSNEFRRAEQHLIAGRSDVRSNDTQANGQEMLASNDKFIANDIDMKKVVARRGEFAANKTNAQAHQFHAGCGDSATNDANATDRQLDEIRGDLVFNKTSNATRQPCAINGNLAYNETNTSAGRLVVVHNDFGTDGTKTSGRQMVARHDGLAANKTNATGRKLAMGHGALASSETTNISHHRPADHSNLAASGTNSTAQRLIADHGNFTANSPNATRRQQFADHDDFATHKTNTTAHRLLAGHRYSAANESNTIERQPPLTSNETNATRQLVASCGGLSSNRSNNTKRQLVADCGPSDMVGVFWEHECLATRPHPAVIPTSKAKRRLRPITQVIPTSRVDEAYAFMLYGKQAVGTTIADCCEGLMTMMYTIRKFDKIRPIVLLVTVPTFFDDLILKKLGVDVRQVPIVQGPERCIEELGEAKIRLLDSYTKVHVWNLTDFRTVVYLESDMLAQDSLDEVFDRFRCIAGEDVLGISPKGNDGCWQGDWSRMYASMGLSGNTGFLVVRPSVRFVQQYIYELKHADFRCGDGSQTLENQVFFKVFGGDSQPFLNLFRNESNTSLAQAVCVPISFNCKAQPCARGDQVILHWSGERKPWKGALGWPEAYCAWCNGRVEARRAVGLPGLSTNDGCMICGGMDCPIVQAVGILKAR